MHCSAGVIAPVFLSGSTKKKRTPISDWNTTWAPGKDKLYHGLVGLGIVTTLFVMGVPLAAILVIALSIMFGKEFYDSFGYGNPDWWDFICGAVCIVVAVVVLWFIFRGKKQPNIIAEEFNINGA